MTNQTNQTVIAFGGISGYINTEVEVKYANNAKKTPYVQLLLGRGKDNNGNPLPTMKLIAYDKDARLLASECKKGDLVRFTEVALQPVKDEYFNSNNIASSFQLVIKNFSKIVRSGNTTSQTTNQPTQRVAPQQTPAPQPQQADDSFDDDIPF